LEPHHSKQLLALQQPSVNVLRTCIQKGPCGRQRSLSSQIYEYFRKVCWFYLRDPAHANSRHDTERGWVVGGWSNSGVAGNFQLSRAVIRLAIYIRASRCGGSSLDVPYGHAPSPPPLWRSPLAFSKLEQNSKANDWCDGRPGTGMFCSW
jgi:hypothetical protein